MQLAIEERLVHDANSKRLSSDAVSKTPKELANIVSRFASSNEWIDRVRLRVDRRWYERLYLGPDYDIWVISWLPGQSTGFHDHGESSGAFIVTSGVLEEHLPGETILEIRSGQSRAFGTDYAHDVQNGSLAPAISIHAYSPPLDEMNEYELDGSLLVPRERRIEIAETLDEDLQIERQKPTESAGALTIEQMLLKARGRFHRLSPEEVYEATVNSGAVLVDVRPEDQRAIEGRIPGALVVERNVLEWRFDPASGARLPVASDHDVKVIIFCSEGYTSSLAAAALQDLGLWRATDMVGGFHAWLAAALPVEPPKRSIDKQPSLRGCATISCL